MLQYCHSPPCQTSLLHRADGDGGGCSLLLSTAGFLAPLGSDRVSWDAGREAGSVLERQISMKKKKKKKVLHCKSTENTWKVENTSEGNSWKRITMSNSGSDPTSALSVPSYGAPAGLCTSMEPPTSRNSSWFPLVSWAE